MSDRQCAALFISAPASNQGKTTLTAALARYHRNLGRQVRVFKTGPDFLDPMILELASGHPVYQLDLWMGDENHCRKLLYEAAGEADLILIEGVMGLFDGDCSSADLATLFGIPVMAMIDGSAMAQTFGAIAYGMANYQKRLPFAGVFANRVAGKRHYEMLKESLPASIECHGWFESNEKIALPERHLGLVQATEIKDLDARIECLAEALTPQNDDLPAMVCFAEAEETKTDLLLKGLDIGVANDDAFSFVYPANLDLLRELGADITYFSPMEDEFLPEVDAIYLPGGYPELYLKQLSNNSEMHSELAEFHRAGKPIVAECGGMMYLLDALTDVDGNNQPMACLLAGRATMQTRLANIGMHKVNLPEGELRGHCFHYSKVCSPLTPISTSKGSRTGQHGEAVYRQRRLTASYMHFYFPSNPDTCAQLFGRSA